MKEGRKAGRKGAGCTTCPVQGAGHSQQLKDWPDNLQQAALYCKLLTSSFMLQQSSSLSLCPGCGNEGLQCSLILLTSSNSSVACLQLGVFLKTEKIGSMQSLSSYVHLVSQSLLYHLTKTLSQRKSSVEIWNALSFTKVFASKVMVKQHMLAKHLHKFKIFCHKKNI